MLNRRNLLDPHPRRRRTGRSGRNVVGDLARRAGRFARQNDEPLVKGGMVDGDAVQALSDLERHRVQLILDRFPAPTAPQLQAPPPVDKRPIVLVGNPRESRRPSTLHVADVSSRASRHRLGDRDPRRCGEQTADAIPLPNDRSTTIAAARASAPAAMRTRGATVADFGEPDPARIGGPEQMRDSRRRTWKGPKEPGLTHER